MLRWALLFFLISLVAAALGFTDIAAGAASIAKVLFFVFLVIFLIFLVLGYHGGRSTLPLASPWRSANSTQRHKATSANASPSIAPPGWRSIFMRATA